MVANSTINNIPAELFIRILGDVPIVDASNILRVNREWHNTYRDIIRRNFTPLFIEILYSNTEVWDIPTRLLPYFRFHSFIMLKLCSLCMSFSRRLGTELLVIKQDLEWQKKVLEKEETEIEKLLDEYENSFEYDGWFPDELWKRRQNSRRAICINFGNLGRVEKIIAEYNGRPNLLIYNLR